MKPNRIALGALALAAAASSAAARDHKETVLHAFEGDLTTSQATEGLVADAQGNLYGTVEHHVFMLSRTKGGWSYSIISDLQDIGFTPSGLVFDRRGNLYGTVLSGGTHGCGAVFELSPVGNGKWQTRMIHDFNATNRHPDACDPQGTPAFDAAGNLFGTSVKGGGGAVGGTFCQNGCGAVWQMWPKKNGNWGEAMIYGFTGEEGNTDGQHPYGSVAFDPEGNLWGTTYNGGTGGIACNKFGDPPGCGTVFELARVSDREWREAFLYSFQSPDTGWQPYAGPAVDASGNVYGTVVNGGPGNGGVFKLTPDGNGSFVESMAYGFAPCDESLGCLDGVFPVGGLTFDADGNLFGTTPLGGGANFNCNPNAVRPTGCGIVFKMTPNAQGGLDETILYRFQENEDGGQPSDDHLVIDAKGHVIGTTVEGGDLSCVVAGARGCGTVFEIK
jgi:uncharacterized repeat protein (TIGR03803 family)